MLISDLTRLNLADWTAATVFQDHLCLLLGECQLLLLTACICYWENFNCLLANSLFSLM